MRLQRRGFNNREHKQRVSYLQQKEDIVFPFFKGVFYIVKNGHWKNDIKRLFSEKMLQKKKVKEKRR